MAGNTEPSYEDALKFSSQLLPKPQETKHLRDSLRANCLFRETTRLRAIVASAPAQLALYRKHIDVLASVDSKRPPDTIPPPPDSSARPGTELAIDKALARLRAEYIMLSEYSAICSSSMAPVRRLPPEILIQVFLPFTPMTREINSKDYRGEIHRLIHHDLLQLAQVCAYWRALAFGTPTFWRSLDLDMMFWSHKMLPLTEAVLERSANSAIQVRIGVPDEVEPDRTLLELIARHSVHWQGALFSMDFKHFTSLAPIRGNLPLLECAHIAGNFDPDSPDLIGLAAAAVKLFSDAPRLTDVTYSGPAKGLEHLPWKQLKRFEYLDLCRFDLSDALSALHYFPPGMQFELRRFWFPAWDAAQALLPPPIESDLTDLTIEFGLHSPGGMREILERLTLRCLSFLELALLNHEHPPIAWDHTIFLRFCARSECGKTLTTLYLMHVAITTDELLESLAELKVLAALVVADHRPSRTRSDPVWLVKDTLFRRLTERAENTQRHLLVPKLAIFGCLSDLRFDEALYLDFVRSRVEVCQSPAQTHFESHVRWYAESARELKPAVLGELQGLSKTKGFVGSIEAANEEEMKTFFY
ncbi:hypothetical protein B0H16DRAFT_1504435 [Mycena metata]|uniref:F-box domain-containing protein n=1 Tax=Mycena metata TaxID=1033252 RepID=A0AAD7NVS9_9AGAR|nr:hypothetical protein B0H16DRAFT_1504435 [Mycena metata]